ncbi:PH domain-containing protein [Saccharothrix sp.]|uniref:PH domain-containing protein n=1 Tax=Saccharothrix sp. TaxID=1873460 RepID=UPI002811DD41|nr:PH domain-containing protein [Saccharothrix sp.]
MSGSTVILRRRAHVVAGVALTCVSLPVLVTLIWTGRARSTFEDTALLVFVQVSVIWLVSLVAKSRIVLSDTGMTVVNWFRKYSVPWSAVHSVDAIPQVSIVLTSGRRIDCAVGGGSVIDNMRGNRRQRDMRSRIESFRGAQAAGGPVREQWDLHLVKFSALLAVMLAYAWLVYR